VRQHERYAGTLNPLDEFGKRVARDEHDHCEICGIRIPLMPEDASAEEMLCDTCLDRSERARRLR